MEDDKLLLEEYRRFAEAFWKNEELGERRVNFFITISTAILAGIIALVTNETPLSEKEIGQITSAALAGTFLFGFITFLRMLKRNRVTDEYKGIMRYLREQLRRRSSSLPEYELPFQPRQKRLLGGGLAESVALMNSILLAAIVVIWVHNEWGWLVAVGVFIVAFIIQSVSAKKGSKGEKPRTQTFRAGVGAVIISHDGKALVLERSDIPGSWQFPQGGLEIGEEPIEAVYREIQEETGIKRSRLSLLPDANHWRLLAYELPKESRSEKTGRGQTQYWFQFRFQGSDDQITLGDKEEFKNWEWRTMDDIISGVIGFRKLIYQELANDQLRFLHIEKLASKANEPQENQA